MCQDQAKGRGRDAGMRACRPLREAAHRTHCAAIGPDPSSSLAPCILQSALTTLISFYHTGVTKSIVLWSTRRLNAQVVQRISFSRTDIAQVGSFCRFQCLRRWNKVRCTYSPRPQGPNTPALSPARVQTVGPLHCRGAWCRDDSRGFCSTDHKSSAATLGDRSQVSSVPAPPR